MLQISKNNLVILLTPVLFFTLIGCGGNAGQDESFRNWCIKKTDTVWTILNKSRAEFVYPMDEIADRKKEMDSFLQLLKFKQPKNVNPELLSMIEKYNSVLTVYKPIAGEYKNAVLKSEDLFYQIKALERTVKNGGYDKKQDDFKKTWNELYRESIENYEHAHEVGSKLSAVEPLYLRIQPKMEALVAELSQ